MSYYVYIHTNKSNGKKYVGKTSQCPKRRWRSGAGYCNNKHFSDAIKKYGWDGFTHECWEVESEEVMNSEEIRLIDELQTTNPDMGYNLTAGGEGISGFHHSEETREKCRRASTGKHPSVETRQKMSKSRKGENAYWYGKHLTDEAKAKLHVANSGENSAWYGKHHTDESRKKMSESTSGENNGFYGKHHTEEHKKARSIAMSGENNPMYGVTSPMKGRHQSESAKEKCRQAHFGKPSGNKGMKWYKGEDGKRVYYFPDETK